MTPAERRKLTEVTGNYKKNTAGEVKPRPPSYSLTVPKWWCRKHGYPDFVDVSEQMDGSLRVEAVRE